MPAPQLPPAEQVWARVVSGLDQDPAEGLNTARECCDRHAGDRSRLAITVRHADGGSQRWTYFDLSHHASMAAAVFAEAGLRRGDRVAAVLSRQIETWICALAAWRSGLTYVPLFCGFGADALAYRLRASRAKLLVVDHQWRPGAQQALELLDTDLEVVTVSGPRGRGIQAGDRSFWAEVEAAGRAGAVIASA